MQSMNNNIRYYRIRPIPFGWNSPKYFRALLYMNCRPTAVAPRRAALTVILKTYKNSWHIILNKKRQLDILRRKISQLIMWNMQKINIIFEDFLPVEYFWDDSWHVPLNKKKASWVGAKAISWLGYHIDYYLTMS